MKDLFKGFYNPSETQLEEAWRNENTLFVLDTNVLLNLYGYAQQTRDDFFGLLEVLGHKLWLPYQVALEYQRNRLEVIRDEKAVFTKIHDNLDKIEKVFKQDFENLALKRRFPRLHENTDKLHKEISKSIAAYKKSVTYWDEKQPCVRSHDPIRTKLNELTEGKIGNPPVDQGWLDNLYQEGNDRYENKTPPGFKDRDKSSAPHSTFTYNGLKYERQYGDLILWQQLIEKAKDESIRNVIFVTDDSKEDWWFILESRGKKKIGPHADLQSEIYRETNLNLFQMYNTSTFLESGKEILDLGVHDSSIQETNAFFFEPSMELDRSYRNNFFVNQLRKKNIDEKLNSIRRHNKYRELGLKYQYGYLDKSELEEFKNWIDERNELQHYLELDRVDSTPDLFDAINFAPDSDDE